MQQLMLSLGFGRILQIVFMMCMILFVPNGLRVPHELIASIEDRRLQKELDRARMRVSDTMIEPAYGAEEANTARIEGLFAMIQEQESSFKHELKKLNLRPEKEQQERARYMNTVAGSICSVSCPICSHERSNVQESEFVREDAEKPRSLGHRDVDAQFDAQRAWHGNLHGTFDSITTALKELRTKLDE